MNEGGEQPLTPEATTTPNQASVDPVDLAVNIVNSDKFKRAMQNQQTFTGQSEDAASVAASAAGQSGDAASVAGTAGTNVEKPTPEQIAAAEAKVTAAKQASDASPQDEELKTALKTAQDNLSDLKSKSGGRRRTKRKQQKNGKSAKKGGKKHRKSYGNKSRRSSSKKSRRHGRK